MGTNYWRFKIISLNAGLVLLFIFDRFTKWLVLNKDKTGFLANQGLAFSLPFSRPLLLILTFSIIFIIFIFLLKAYQKRRITFISGLSLMIIGAVSNFYDRVGFSYVIDFISFGPYNMINLADIYIISGIMIISLSLISKK